MTEPSDLNARRAAVAPDRSVIVQAPAGSGKTTLLVERYLGLLATVEVPEEILAITFTRKAAAEMRHRVLEYLDPALESDEPHKQGMIEKARAAAEKVEAWGLRENPQRLQIRTIDSFNGFLARAMPVASRLGPVPAPLDNADQLYRRAARAVLARMDGDDDLAADIARLLTWRDHNARDIEDLLAGLLGKREQWLRVLGPSGTPDRAHVEGVLVDLVRHELGLAREELDTALADTTVGADGLLELLRFAADHLRAEGKPSAVIQCLDLETLPGDEPADLPCWRGLGELLLTRDGNFRAKVNKRDGFPAKTDEKGRITALLERLGDHAALAARLDRARSLPEPHYDEADWQTLQALIRVLQAAAAELELVFAEAGHMDFAGLSDAALRGLGDVETGITDLGLYLDRRLRHILVDEFQDTNWSQFRLLEKLTDGWEPDDGRTLFLVGDPMQSIYRFREAEVGLFMRLRDYGINDLPLATERLSDNFRSRAEIVGWVNERLGPIFPEHEDITAGAVGYAASRAGRSEGGAVELVARADRAAEAKAVVGTVQRELAEHAGDPDFSAAIIVRSRNHLVDIVPALKAAGQRFRAVKLDPLVTKPVVQDLLAITRVILDPADRTHLLAVLRSPVCGLTLADLHALAGDGADLFDDDALERLDSEARERAARVFRVLNRARTHWQRWPLRDLVEGAWHGLGGPACLADPASDRRDAERYLAFLERAGEDGLLHDPAEFYGQLETELAEGDPESEDVKLEILTMHAAKGLEWDLVVLPGLDRSTRGRDRDLLHWLPFTGGEGDERVLLAPLRSASETQNPPLVEFIRGEKKTRDAFENQRLLYVAATRAREKLVLAAALDPDKPAIKPSAGSLLADLWPTVGGEFIEALQAADDEGDTPVAPELPDQSLRRVPADWTPPVGRRFDWTPAHPPREREVEIEFNWAGIQARRNGTVLHRLLERVGQLGIENLDAERRSRLVERLPHLLKSMGTGPQAVKEAVPGLVNALEQTLDSETGQWMLRGDHEQSACELALTGIVDGDLVNAVVDRTFIDENGTRWIIDYKSGYHEGGDLDAFLAGEEERYRKQLALYARLFRQMDETDVRCALYLPMHAAWREVEIKE